MAEESNEIQKYTALVYATFNVVEKLLSLPPDKLLDEASKQLAHLFKADHVALLLSENGDLAVKSEYFTDKDDTLDFVFTDEKLQSVRDTGETLFSFDERREDIAVGDTPGKAIRNSFVIAAAFPLVGDEGNLGTLYAAKYSHNFYHRPPFLLAYNNLTLLCSLASAIALCIENASDKAEITVKDVHIHSLITFLSQLRSTRKMSLREVAEKSGGIIDQTWLSKAEKKNFGDIRQQHSRLIALARVYGVQTELLLALAGLEVPPSWRDNQVVDGWLLDMLEDRVLVNILYKLSQESDFVRDTLFRQIDIQLDRNVRPLDVQSEQSAFFDQSEELSKEEFQETVNEMIHQIKKLSPLSVDTEFSLRRQIRESGSFGDAIELLVEIVAGLEREQD